ASFMPQAAATATASSTRMRQPRFIAPVPTPQSCPPATTADVGTWRKFVVGILCRLAPARVSPIISNCCLTDTKSVAIRTRMTPIGSHGHKLDARRDHAAYVLLLLLAGCFGLTVLVFQPGYITIDARYVYADAQAWHFGDWQSPAMGVLWRIIDPIAPGAWS